MMEFPNAEDKMLYGGTLQARFRAVQERQGVDGLLKLVKKMKKQGYSGPTYLEQIKAKGQYPLTDLLILLHTYKKLWGEEALWEMSTKAPQKRGIKGMFIKWAGTPKLLVHKAGGYWDQFYAFGELNGSIITTNKALLIGNDICVDEIMCESLAYYYKGVLEMAKVKKVKCEHAKCELRGDKIGKWVLTWE